MPGKAVTIYTEWHQSMTPRRHGSRDELYWLVKLFVALLGQVQKGFTDTTAHKLDLRMDFDNARQALKAAVQTPREADVADSLL
jgi:hypothetical protein